jgi:hypothetical protein
MRFYTHQHKHYCGIDLHARAMYVCILDQHGTKLVHKNLPTTPEAFLRVLRPYREDLVVGVECMVRNHKTINYRNFVGVRGRIS